MGFLRRDDDDAQSDAQPQADATALARAEAPHQATYEAGSLAGIPDSGRERIARMKQEVARGFFTSDLSVNEFLLVKQSGFEPLGLVLGSSIYHIGWQQAGWNQSQELAVLTQAMYHARELAMKRMGRNVEMPNFTQALYEARELAMERMQREADELQAGGIVGARIVERSHGWGSHVIEFFALGTAVVPTGGEHEIEKPAMVLPLSG